MDSLLPTLPNLGIWDTHTPHPSESGGGKEGPGSHPVAGKKQRVQTTALGSQQGAGAAHRGAEPGSRWPPPLHSVGTGLPNRVVWELHSGAIPWPPCSELSRCARLAHVCSSKHPPAPGNPHVGWEPLTWAKNPAVGSVFPTHTHCSCHRHILDQVRSELEGDNCSKGRQSPATAPQAGTP